MEPGRHVTLALSVIGDPELLERALSNVLANAFKFMPDGGTVRVSVGVGDTHGDGSAFITVRDSGPGIPAHDLGLVFDRFHRAASTAGAHPGTGIGLALARELVLRHGGSITAESEEGFGSTFVVTQPLGSAHLLPTEIVDDDAAPWTPRARPVLTPASFPALALEASAQDASAPDVGAAVDDNDIPTVLMVDDNDENRAYVKRHPTPTYRVLEAANGQQGLELARRHLPDLVFSDLMMPVMDCFALCRALKSDPETDFVPVILLTARAEADDRLVGLSERADYLTKPFDVAELLARIANTIATRRLLRERYARTGAGPTVHPTVPTPINAVSADQRFLNLVRTTVEANLVDESFTVERLAADVAQSRGNLHRRLRDLSGETPSDLSVACQTSALRTRQQRLQHPG